MLYKLINPSDPYTFHATSIEVAGVCAVLLSQGFGAVDTESGESTPALFGWNEWIEEHGIDDKWVKEHSEEIAEAYEWH